MPAYQVGDIRIKSGVAKKADGTFKGFLDFPITLEWTNNVNYDDVKWHFLEIRLDFTVSHSVK